MMGSFLSRAFLMILGYAYPAYECYKSVEMNKPEIENLRFWCQYWILVALLTVFERIGDAFISWLPMYREAKLAFFIYLWYPKTKGTSYVYNSFFRPLIAKHETDIDRNLLELRTRAGDVAAVYWQKTVCYGQARFFEVLQYVASQLQSVPQPSRTHPVQDQQQIHHEEHPVKPAPKELSKARNGESSPKPETSPRPIQIDAKTVANHARKPKAMHVYVIHVSAIEGDSNSSPSKERV